MLRAVAPPSSATPSGSAGGDLTGTYPNPTINDVDEQSLTANSSSLSIDFSQGSYVILTLSASVSSLTVSNWKASGKVSKLVLEVRSTGAFNITSWASAKWPSGTAPTVTSGNGSKDVYALVTADGGTTIYGNVVGQNYS